jgi:hypothetical protein
VSSNTIGWIEALAPPVLIFAAFLGLLILKLRKANRLGFAAAIFPDFLLRQRRSEGWLKSPKAIVSFSIATISILASTVMSYTVGPHPGEFVNTLAGILGVLGGLSAFYLWGGMWFFWVDLHTRGRRGRILWAILLTVGLWYGAILYFLAVYLPAMKLEKELPLNE